MWRVTALSLLFISNLLFAGNLSDYINQAKTYGSSPPVGTIQNQLNTLFCNGTDCSYSGVDYHSFDRENEARNLYLEKASNPNDPLGQGLSTMWKLSEIKSTTPYKEAEKLYECVKISPDGKCEMYQAETYYGECKTVQECISWNTQEFYANYTCTIDSLFEQRTGETENLCFKYNIIEPQLKEKYHTCFVVQNEYEKYCYKERKLTFGTCKFYGKFVLALGKIGDNYWCGTCKIYKLQSTFEIKNLSAIQHFYLTDLYFDDWIEIKINGYTVYVGPYGGEYIKLTQNCLYSWCWTVVEYAPGKTGPCELSTSWHTTPNIDVRPYLKEGLNYVDITVVVSGCGEGYAKFEAWGDGDAIVCTGDYCTWEGTSGTIGWKCDITGNFYSDASTCYANCYTEEIQDCQVQ